MAGEDFSCSQGPVPKMGLLGLKPVTKHSSPTSQPGQPSLNQSLEPWLFFFFFFFLFFFFFFCQRNCP